MKIFEELLSRVANRKPVVLCTVINSNRSVPRKAGAKMLVFEDGSTHDTIGGGEMESRVISEAIKAIKEKKPRQLNYALVNPSEGDPGVCGGEVAIYLEPYMPQTTIYILGAGHIGKAVSELSEWLGYRVIVWDDREEVINGFEGEGSTLSGPLMEALSVEPIDEHTRVVVVTRNAEVDSEILPTILDTPAPYIGVMGSGQRWKIVRDTLIKEGVSEQAVDRIATPIGLAIAAESPEEIAVSILAEVIAGENVI
ncbi:MAG TPA: XdhC family protein [Acidimicrobiales bacterium]|nr:XdhC family protein [Acidimicrobiales bacterium]